MKKIYIAVMLFSCLSSSLYAMKKQPHELDIITIPTIDWEKLEKDTKKALRQKELVAYLVRAEGARLARLNGLDPHQSPLIMPPLIKLFAQLTPEQERTATIFYALPRPQEPSASCAQK